MKKIISLSIASTLLFGYNHLKVGQTKPLNDMTFNFGSVTFSNGYKMDNTWGLGSAAAHKAGDPKNIIYVMTDRGVNIKCKDDKKIIGMDICKKGKIFPYPDFTPTIVKLKIDNNKVKVLKVIPLKDSNGKNISGISPKLSNFPETPYDINGKVLKNDPNGLDTEALYVKRDGSFWIGEEYGPSLVNVSKDGKILKRLVPKNLAKEFKGATYPVIGALPNIISKRHPNRGIEAIALSPDEKYIYFALQSPLDNPKYSKSRDIRFYKMDLSNYNNIKEYLYKEDLASSFIADNKKKKRKQKKVKVSEMVCIGKDKLIFDERISKESKFYLVDLSKEQPIPKDRDLTLEQNDEGIKAVKKELVYTSVAKKGKVPSKVEGVANLGDNRFFLINDNDFGIEGAKEIGNIVKFNLK